METTHRITLTERGQVTHISTGDLDAILDEAAALEAPYSRAVLATDLEQDGYSEFDYNGMTWTLEAI